MADPRNPDAIGRSRFWWTKAGIERHLRWRCAISDVDGHTERLGNFLYIENKRPGELLSLGQIISLEKRCWAEESTALLVVGVPGDPDEDPSFSDPQEVWTWDPWWMHLLAEHDVPFTTMPRLGSREPHIKLILTEIWPTVEERRETVAQLIGHWQRWADRNRRTRSPHKQWPEGEE